MQRTYQDCNMEVASLYTQSLESDPHLLQRLRRGDLNVKVILPQLQGQQEGLAATNCPCAALGHIAGHALHASTIQPCAVGCIGVGPLRCGLRTQLTRGELLDEVVI